MIAVIEDRNRLLNRRSKRIEMDDPPDRADTTFQRLLNREILLSERRRMLILAALQAFILVLTLFAATFVPGFVRSIYHDRLPVVAASASGLSASSTESHF